MESEKLQVQFAPGMTKAELVIREGEAVKELPLKAPVKTNLSGIIGAPYEFLQKRISELEQIDQKRCHVIVNREKVEIILITNDNDEYLSGMVSGALEQHPKFLEFGINQPKAWEPKQLGDFFRMNVAFFPDKKENMKLVADLKNFKAKVNSVQERSKQDNGSINVSYSQAVESNLPGTFKILLPVFKGMEYYPLDVEVISDINGMDVSLHLICPAVVSLLEEIRNRVIDEQLDLISALAPEIAIIEK